ncbi:MAG: TraR/DksA family transcriptional regulator [Bdellovibrionota bacterium]|nr:TraR/DksA family transcriptional regulator [Bdellovibrionota bacterium]
MEDNRFVLGQKEQLLRLRNELLNAIKYKSTEDLHIPSDEIVEDGDQAQTYINQNVSFGLRERELSRLRELESALLRIENGSYGFCEETDEPIEKKRLQKVPWARLSIAAAEEKEREEYNLRKPKTV